MDNTHDPQRQIGYLQQCLSSSKKPIGLFLGAGCPVAVKLATEGNPPLIPDIAGITKAVRDSLEQSEACAPILKIVDEQFSKDGRANVNVEDMLSHVRSLRLVAGKGDVRGLSAKNLDTLDEQICERIHGLVDKLLPSSDTPYHKLASWIDALGRERPVEIFTTNYDLLMEQALEDCRVPYFDGFAGARKPLFDLRAMEEDEIPPRWARLWKLHGSINWFQGKSSDVFRGASTETGLKRVIHPSHLKYDESRRMPYLAMIDRLRAFLKQPTATLVLCGYSFRDVHLNEVIVQGLQGTPTAIGFALMFDSLGAYPVATKLAMQRPNFTVLGKDAAVISSRSALWIDKSLESLGANPSDWVQWKPKDAAKPSGSQAATFSLGDFANFGRFVQELVGKVREAAEQPGAP